MNDPFARSQPDGCLSAFRVSRAALDELGDDERGRVDAHLATCARCAERVADERASVAAAALEPIPAALRARPARPAGWRRWLGPLAGAVAAAAAFILVVLPSGPPDGPGTHLKGGTSPVPVEATVVRGEQTVIADRALAELGPLADGDRMRLRIRGAAGRAARVEGLDAGDWVEVWRGAVPEDGWLPFGLTASAGSETALRVALCKPGVALPEGVFAAGFEPEGCALGSWILEVR